MICYLDTSALVKRYIEELGSDKVAECIEQAHIVVVSRLAYVETLSALVRRRPSLRNCSDEQFQLLVDNFRCDWNSFTVLGLNDEMLQYVDRILVAHRLRGADSIHLSAALSFRKLAKTPVLFVAADTELVKAAVAEKFEVLNPTD